MMCDVLNLETQKMCSGAHPLSTGLSSDDDGMWILLLELQQVYTLSKTAVWIHRYNLQSFTKIKC